MSRMERYQEVSHTKQTAGSVESKRVDRVKEVELSSLDLTKIGKSAALAASMLGMERNGQLSSNKHELISGCSLSLAITRFECEHELQTPQPLQKRGAKKGLP